MRRCPKCKECYGDHVDTCAYCEIDLTTGEYVPSDNGKLKELTKEEKANEPLSRRLKILFFVLPMWGHWASMFIPVEYKRKKAEAMRWSNYGIIPFIIIFILLAILFFG